MNPAIVTTMVSFIIMLNPFALFLYLTPVINHLSKKQFMIVLLKATLISYLVYFVFILTGDFLFTQVFQIDFNSFRVFGGIVIFSFAYFYIVKGRKALIELKGSLDDLASEIALPFMVGAGTISLAILMGNELPLQVNIILLPAILAINYFIILGLNAIREGIPTKKVKIAFDKAMGIMLRISGFFVGAIGINMILKGIQNIYF